MDSWCLATLVDLWWQHWWTCTETNSFRFGDAFRSASGLCMLEQNGRGRCEASMRWHSAYPAARLAGSGVHLDSDAENSARTNNTITSVMTSTSCICIRSCLPRIETDQWRTNGGGWDAQMFIEASGTCLEFIMSWSSSGVCYVYNNCYSSEDADLKDELPPSFA